jgi:luciferase family oxidoreductase group 1
VRISVLDTSPIVAGSTPRQALLNTVDLAKHVERLGYHRYWVPEHHGMRGVASSAPAVVVARLADATSRIRVGSGGVLLPNHPPLVVAEQFGTLAAFHPGRIDLGIGRAPGGPPHAVQLVRRSAAALSEQLSELLGYFTDSSVAIPAIGNVPSVWLLGQSVESAELARSHGLSYAYAHHLNQANASRAMKAYDGPLTLVSVSVIAADTDEYAEWLAGSTRLKVLSRLRGQRILLPSPENAAAYPYTNEDRAAIAERANAVVVGSPERVREQLQAILDATGTSELMVTTPVYDHAERLRSYELVGRLAKDLSPVT